MSSRLFKVEIETDNAAFIENDAAHEVGRILRKIDEKLRSGVTAGACIDVNGNKVGEWSLHR